MEAVRLRNCWYNVGGLSVVEGLNLARLVVSRSGCAMMEQVTRVVKYCKYGATEGQTKPTKLVVRRAMRHCSARIAINGLHIGYRVESVVSAVVVSDRSKWYWLGKGPI